MREIDELLTLCRYAGGSIELGQGAGGNASVKRSNDEVMWIKASGCRLSDVRRGHGYVGMRLPRTDRLARVNSDSDLHSLMQSLLLYSSGLRPSMETSFHAVLGRVVLHTHAIYANAFSCMHGGDGEFSRLLARRPAIVEYELPGRMLGTAVDRSAKDYQQQYGRPARHFLLINHGLITTGDSTTEAIYGTNEVISAGRRFFGLIEKGDFAAVDTSTEAARWACELERETGMLARPARLACLANFDDSELPEPLVPDDVVCNGPSVLRARSVDEVAGLVSGTPAAIAVEGKGVVFQAPSFSMMDAMEEQLAANVAVRRLIRRRGKCRPLQEPQKTPLASMEAEKHRQSMLAAGVGACR